MSDLLVLSADAIARPRRGRLCLHTTGSRLPAFETDDAMLMGWLLQFAQAHSLEAALAALPPEHRKYVTQAVDYLRRSGVLVEAGAATQTAPAPADGPAAGQAATLAATQTRQHLRALARSVYELASDILAEGNSLETRLEQASGVGTERRLVALLAGIDNLRSEVHAARDARLRQELAALPIEEGNLKLHLGCGNALLDGWINIDVAPAPLALNLLRGLPLPDHCASFVFVSHALEHLFYPADVRPFLAEVRRVLQPGGVLRVVVPDVEASIVAYAERDATFFASRRETWSWWPENPSRLEDFLAYAGAGPEPAWGFESHKYGYDMETLEKVLSEAGFSDIRRCGFMQSPHPELQVDASSTVASARYGERSYSLFAEAQCPVKK